MPAEILAHRDCVSGGPTVAVAPSMPGMVWQAAAAVLADRRLAACDAAAGERLRLPDRRSDRSARCRGRRAEHAGPAGRSRDAASVAPKRTRRSASPSHAASSASPKTMKITPAGIHISSRRAADPPARRHATPPPVARIRVPDRRRDRQQRAERAAVDRGQEHVEHAQTVTRCGRSGRAPSPTRTASPRARSRGARARGSTSLRSAASYHDGMCQTHSADGLDAGTPRAARSARARRASDARRAERVRHGSRGSAVERPHPGQQRMAERQQRRRDQHQQRVLRHVDREQDLRQPRDRRHQRGDQRRASRRRTTPPPTSRCRGRRRRAARAAPAPTA